jgi:hypothetical protein
LAVFVNSPKNYGRDAEPMKAFRFSLDRVLHWHETTLKLEEMKVESLKAALRSARQTRDDLPRRRAATQLAIGQAPVVLGRDIAELERFNGWTLREERRLTARMLELQHLIEEQIVVVTEARRRVRLVERLKDRRYESWKAEENRETENLAGEAAISQWRRLDSRPV